MTFKTTKVTWANIKELAPPVDTELLLSNEEGRQAWGEVVKDGRTYLVFDQYSNAIEDHSNGKTGYFVPAYWTFMPDQNGDITEEDLLANSPKP